MKQHIENAKEKIPVKQILSYLWVGGATTGLGYLLYYIFIVQFGMWYLFSSAVIDPLAILLNYLMHRSITFNSTGSKRKQVPKYVTLVVFNYLAGLLILFVTVDILGFDPLLGKILAMSVVFLWNYLALKLVVFGSSTTP